MNKYHFFASPLPGPWIGTLWTVYTLYIIVTFVNSSVVDAKKKKNKMASRKKY